MAAGVVWACAVFFSTLIIRPFVYCVDTSFDDGADGEDLGDGEQRLGCLAGVLATPAGLSRRGLLVEGGGVEGGGVGVLRPDVIEPCRRQVTGHGR